MVRSKGPGSRRRKDAMSRLLPSRSSALCVFVVGSGRCYWSAVNNSAMKRGKTKGAAAWR